MSLLQRVKNFFDPQYLVKKDLIRGEIPGRREAYSSFVKIAMPAVIEMVLISLISAADTAMVGTVGDAAIAAVGITSQPMMILLSIFFALNIGVTAVVARRKGEERQDDANTVMRMALCICVLLGIVMTLIAVFFAEELMVFAGAKPEIIGDAVAYFRIVTSVLALRALTMAITAAQRGAGNTKITMRINTTANIVNVCLNFLLIGGNFGCPALGVEGAAIATAVGNTVGFVMAVMSLRKGHGHFLYIARGQSWKYDKDAVKAIFKVSSNAIFEQLVLRVGFFLYARIVADLSVEDFSTHQICMQALNLSFTFADGLGVGATALVGQNLGRERPDLSIMYGKIGQRIAAAFSAVIMLFFIFGGSLIVGIFTDTPSIIEKGSIIMILAGCLMPLQTSTVVLGGSLRGAGDTKYVANTMLLAGVSCGR
ncbi:MAG: MATE family efflux transporter [Clostridia bacterium]|nr:MATE family efflux transporter [Clostridia bacterium]